jgi:hypothetical protein
VHAAEFTEDERLTIVKRNAHAWGTISGIDSRDVRDTPYLSDNRGLTVVRVIYARAGRRKRELR